MESDDELGQEQQKWKILKLGQLDNNSNTLGEAMSSIRNNTQINTANSPRLDQRDMIYEEKCKSDTQHGSSPKDSNEESLSNSSIGEIPNIEEVYNNDDASPLKRDTFHKQKLDESDLKIKSEPPLPQLLSLSISKRAEINKEDF